MDPADRSAELPSRQSEWQAHLRGFSRARAGRHVVLVVDDHVDSAEATGTLLELAGHTVSYASDGGSALERVRSLQPDVIFLDIEMPGLSGYEVCRRLRRLGLDRKPRIIALSGCGDPDYEQKCAEVGFDFWMTKPIDAAALAELA